MIHTSSEPSASLEPMRNLRAEDLAPLNAALENATAESILRWTARVFGPGAAVMTAMQKSGCVVCQLLHALELHRQIDVLFVDTGVNFRETYETLDHLRERYGLNLIALHPARTMEQQCREEGVLYLTPDGQKRCCALRKKDPLRQIQGRYQALIASLRRDEGGKRAHVPVLAIDEELNALRVHPLVAWSREDVQAHIRRHDVVVNPLHAQGYPTVGCDRCTTPVLEGEDERAGRWRHLENAPKYCNINPTDRERDPRAPGAASTPSVQFPETLARRLFSTLVE